MSRQQFLFNQDQLDLLCADRKLRTSEIHKPNDFYGQASALKRYAGLPQGYALKGVLEHGPSLRDELWEQDLAAPLPMNLAVSEGRARLFRTHTGKPTIPIGFGYLYAMRVVDRDYGHVGPRVGTLAFPCHSTHSVQCKFDHGDYAGRLAALPASMQPVAVCAYWKDFLVGSYRPYSRRGISLVTAGHMYDADFLLRFHDLCRRFRFAVSNHIGSHLFQSVASGCDFQYVNSTDLQFELPVDEETRLSRGREQLLENIRRSHGLFDQGTKAGRIDQRRFVEGVLGTKCLLTPAQLRALLIRAEFYDKFRTAPRDSHANWSVPPFLRRQSARSQRLCRSVAKRLPLVSWKRSA